MAKDRRSRDQKRKALLNGRAKRHSTLLDVQPFKGAKYQRERWSPHVFATELAVYETIQLSNNRLTNDQVHEAFISLVKQLRQGLAPVVDEEQDEIFFAAGNEVNYLVWNIRRHWTGLVEEHGPVDTHDFVGILRTLLNSIKAHAWNTGKNLGYVHFLKGFMARMA